MGAGCLRCLRGQVVTGSFELVDDGVKRPVSFSGVLRQKDANLSYPVGSGHYLLPPLAGTEKLSGSVLFSR